MSPNRVSFVCLYALCKCLVVIVSRPHLNLVLFRTLSILTKPVVESSAADTTISPPVNSSVELAGSGATTDVTASSYLEGVVATGPTPVSPATAPPECHELTKLNYDNNFSCRASETPDDTFHPEKQDKTRPVTFLQECGQPTVNAETNALDAPTHGTNSGILKSTSLDSAINNS